MKDSDLRAAVLQKYYDLRRRDYFQWCEIDDADLPIGNASDLFRICDQLGEHGLIDWKPVRALGGAVGGVGKITALGVDVVEGNQRSPVTITFDNRHNVSISNSSHVQVGNHNSISAYIQVENLKKAIEESEFSAPQKEEAKSLLSKFLEHPVTAALIGGLASNLK